MSRKASNKSFPQEVNPSVSTLYCSLHFLFHVVGRETNRHFDPKHTVTYLLAFRQRPMTLTLARTQISSGRVSCIPLQYNWENSGTSFTPQITLWTPAVQVFKSFASCFYFHGTERPLMVLESAKRERERGTAACYVLPHSHSHSVVRSPRDGDLCVVRFRCLYSELAATTAWEFRFAWIWLWVTGWKVASHLSLHNAVSQGVRKERAPKITLCDFSFRLIRYKHCGTGAYF